MSYAADDFDAPLGGREPNWWRWHGEWHLGWAPHELRWLREGRPFPEHWDYHRAGTRWEAVTYIEARECAAAGHPNTNIYVWTSERGGHRWARETCEDCGERVGSQIGTRRLKALGLDRNSLPLANSNVITREVCARCGGDESVEYHHWAPRHLFEDADNWPGDYLCRACHQRWHRVVTPTMSRRTAS